VEKNFTLQQEYFMATNIYVANVKEAGEKKK